MASRYTLSLLGAPKFTENGTERHLPSRRALALLACLAFDGRATRARLATTFWSDSNEAVARRNLRRELTRLRAAGFAAAFDADLETVRLGAAVATDHAPFEAACERGDHGAALALWRGPLLDGFVLAGAPAFDAWLVDRREALVRRWREAAASVAAQAEAAGDGRAALEWRLRLLADDPLQEAHHAAVMRLHFLLGERSAALAVYERCRQRLRDELGLAPLASTAELAERIRAAERVAPMIERHPDATLQRLDTPLIGRAAEAELLRRRRSAVILLQGEPGVGKTRLAQECLLARATLSIRCEAVAQGAALYPFAEAARAELERFDRRERLATLSATDRREAARLLPTLDPEARFDAGRAGGVIDRNRFFNALGEVFDRLAGPGGTLWIDDLHWADESTLALVAHLAHRCAADPQAHAHIVAAARSEELEANPAARDAVRGLERAGLLERVPLARFSAGETLALVQALAASVGGTLFSARLQRATQGNPYYLLETIRFLFDAGELQLDPHGAWATRYDDATADYAELPVPPTLAATVIERVDRLGAATRRVLETAALTSAGFTLAQVQPATALSEWEALDGLERAVRAELLVAFAPGYRFVHDLAREALGQQLGSERRRLIHDRLARALIAQHGRAELIATHLQGAERPAEALAWRIAAGRETERLFAWRDALAQYDQALAIGVEPADEVSIRRSRASVLRTLHDLPGMQRELDALDALAAQTGDAGLAVEVLANRTELGVKRHRYVDAIAHARAAWAHPAWPGADAALRQRATRFGAFALVENADYDEALAIYRRELESAATLSPSYLGDLFSGMANYHSSFTQDDLVKVYIKRSVDCYRAAGLDEDRLRSENIAAYAEYMTGDHRGAIETMQRILDEAEQLKHVSLLRVTLLNFVLYALETGDTDRAARQLARAEELLQGVDDPATQARLQIRVSEVAAQRGELGRAVAAARKALALIEANGGGLPDFWPWFVLSRLLWWIGDRDAAVRVYRELPQSPAWLATAAPAVRFFCAAWALPDDAVAAATLLEPIEAASGVLVAEVPIAFFRALALHRLGRDGEALALLEPAAGPAIRTGFVVRTENRVALRIDVRVALGVETSAAIADAEALLPVAAPLLALRLRRSVAAALDSEGEAARAAEHRSAAEALAASLSDSLAG